MRTLNACPSCGGRSLMDKGVVPASPYFAGKQLRQPLPGGNLVACSTCALYFKNPQVTKDRLDALYEAGEEEHWQHDSGLRIDWDIAYRWISSMRDASAVLDIGCFDGQFLSKLSIEKSCFGVEIHPGASRKAKAKGIEMLGSDFDVLRDLSPKFDVVTAFDVIEHVHNPHEFLGSLLAVLRPGGHVILSTGNTESLSWKFMGSAYWYCAIPEHISFVNPTWTQGVCREFDVELLQTKRFSHARSSSPINRMKEAVKNVVYRISPSAAAAARRFGSGRMSLGGDPSGNFLPPPWLTARDHFITLIQKPT